MTEVEKAYIAGIIDGEGSIMLQKFHKNEFPSPCVSVASTTLELLNWLKEKIGGGKIIRKKNYNPDKHSDCYSYFLKYNEAINLIQEIYPYLIIESKKRRANLILEKYKAVTPRNGRYSEELLKAKNKFYEDFISIK
ncbi:LAGLIDADG family homing endonuclease [Clostridium sp.]|uniref:LAGLIDADG family homing endonuclease n=1 Tax=Clostridium sp. TaxID=1506 RepID=UPI003F3032C5